MSIHTCDAFVVACIDFRFQKYLRKWLEENMADKTYDYVGFAGSTKNLDIIMGQLNISVRLHQVKQVIFIHHEECGAYGAESTHDRHATDLKKARELINKKYPDLKVDLYYLHLDGEFERI
jgi:carbonic anhydrase